MFLKILHSTHVTEVLSTVALFVLYLLFLYPALLSREISLNVHSSSYQTESPVGVVWLHCCRCECNEFYYKVNDMQTFSEFVYFNNHPLHLM